MVVSWLLRLRAGLPANGSCHSSLRLRSDLGIESDITWLPLLILQLQKHEDLILQGVLCVEAEHVEPSHKVCDYIPRATSSKNQSESRQQKPVRLFSLHNNSPHKRVLRLVRTQPSALFRQKDTFKSPLGDLLQEPVVVDVSSKMVRKYF